MNPPLRKPAATRGGAVLIVVLLVCLGLVSVTLLFGHSMLMTFRGADNELAGRQADQAIEGGVRYAETLLANVTTPGLLPDVTSYTAEAVPVGEGRFWFIGQPTETVKSGTPPVFGLVDEASKLNLNTATVEMLEGLPGMTTELAASIIDWRDADENVTENGAESETYARRQPPYNCKNAPFETIEELALVNGADRGILLGEDANLNGALDPNEDDGDRSLPADNSDGKLDAGILSYVTVYSRAPNTRADGSPRVNVRRVNPEVQTLLRDTLGDARAAAILAGAQAWTSRSVLEFYVYAKRNGMTEDEFAQVADLITTSTGNYVNGRVNVNTAGETVLACLPGIGPDKAATLVAARLSRATQDTRFTWIVATLGDDGAIAAGPWITGQSFQVCADIAAVGRHGRGYRRTKVILDRSTGTPRVIYRRNLAPLGWALGSAARDSLASRKETR